MSRSQNEKKSERNSLNKKKDRAEKNFKRQILLLFNSLDQQFRMRRCCCIHTVTSFRTSRRAIMENNFKEVISLLFECLAFFMAYTACFSFVCSGVMTSEIRRISKK